MFNQLLKSIKKSPKAIAFISALAVALPMTVSAGEAKAFATFRLASGVALNTNYSFRRVHGQPRMSLWRHNLHDIDQQFMVLPNPDASWRFQQRSTNKCLNAHNTWNGGEINVWHCNPNDPDQRFDMDVQPGGAILLRRRGTNLCVDAPEFRNAGRIHLWECMPNNPHQRWYPSIVGPDPTPWASILHLWP